MSSIAAICSKTFGEVPISGKKDNLRQLLNALLCQKQTGRNSPGDAICRPPHVKGTPLVSHSAFDGWFSQAAAVKEKG
jgi:hypothetical protein